jgi:hypothetical protein
VSQPGHEIAQAVMHGQNTILEGAEVT